MYHSRVSSIGFFSSSIENKFSTIGKLWTLFYSDSSVITFSSYSCEWGSLLPNKYSLSSSVSMEVKISRARYVCRLVMAENLFSGELGLKQMLSKSFSRGGLLMSLSKIGNKLLCEKGALPFAFFDYIFGVEESDCVEGGVGEYLGEINWGCIVIWARPPTHTHHIVLFRHFIYFSFEYLLLCAAIIEYSLPFILPQPTSPHKRLSFNICHPPLLCPTQSHLAIHWVGSWFYFLLLLIHI